MTWFPRGPAPTIQGPWLGWGYAVYGDRAGYDAIGQCGGLGRDGCVHVVSPHTLDGDLCMHDEWNANVFTVCSCKG
jgi:hypothetical protein